jgi:hypothetical protein
VLIDYYLPRVLKPPSFTDAVLENVFVGGLEGIGEIGLWQAVLRSFKFGWQQQQ